MTKLSKAGQWLKAQNTPSIIRPATQETKEARFANTIRIEFWNGEFTRTDCNDRPVSGKVNNQDHATSLLKRAMEQARDEGKKLVVKNGMTTSRFETVTDEDIEIHAHSSAKFNSN